jgi:hypothetical protein
MRATYTAGRERLYNTTYNNINKPKSIEDINTKRITYICWDVSAFLKVVPKRDKVFVDLCKPNSHTACYYSLGYYIPSDIPPRHSAKVLLPLTDSKKLMPMNRLVLQGEALLMRSGASEP